MTQPAPVPAPPPGDPVPAPTDPTPTPPSAPDPALQDAGKKALAEERAARKAAEKAVAEQAAKLKEFEDRDKTEAQKLADRATAAEQNAAAKDAELLRLRTALKHGISDEDAETFLTGTDEATLTKQAERLAALARATGPRTPAPDPSQGARGGQPSPDLDAQIAEAEKAGRWQDVIALKRQKTFQK